MAKKKAQLNRIKEVLTEKKKSQTWLAAALDVDFVTVSRYVNNHRQPNLDTLSKICKVLGVRGCDLLNF